jgi:transcriptional regulator with GAF, ATPase, and Fis domain
LEDCGALKYREGTREKMGFEEGRELRFPPPRTVDKTVVFLSTLDHFLRGEMASDIETKIDAIHSEIAIIKAKLEAIQDILSEEEASEDDKLALEEAMGEHERGETIPLDEVLKKLK